MPDAAGDGRWQEGVEPALRRRVLEKILGKLVQLYEGRPAPSHDLNRIATSFEQKMFNEANSKEEYIKRIAYKLLIMERNRQPVLQDASGLNQHLKMGCQMQPVNHMQAIHGCNSSITTMPQVSPTMSSHQRQSPHTRNLPITPSGSSPVTKQHMPYPVAPNMHIKNGQTDAVTMLDQILKSSPAIVTPSSPGVHSTQLTMQSGKSQNQNKLPVMQMQPINFSTGNATSVTQSQGQSVVQPNGQQNPLRQNTRGTYMHSQQQLRMNHQGLVVNQQKMNRQNSQMLVAQQANVSKMQTDNHREQNNQQNAGLNVASPLQTDKHITMEPQHLITVNQQSSLHNVIPQTVASTGSVEEVDWREEMFQQIKALKDAYLSELVELDEINVVPKLTKEEIESLPKVKAEQYRFRVYMKKRVRAMLNFLQFQKSNIPDHWKGQLHMFVKAIQDMLGFYRRKKDQRAEMDIGRQSLISKPPIVNLTGDPAPSSGCTSSQQKQPGQPVAFHLRQDTATRTPAASAENHGNILLGVASSCVPERSPGSVQSLPSNKLNDYCTPSPVTKESPVKVSSPSASAKSTLSSPVATPGAVIGASPSVSSPIDKPDLKVASPSALVKSTLPSPIDMFGLQAALSCAPPPARSSSSPSPVAKAGNVTIATPLASVSPLSSQIEKVGVAQAPSPCPPVKSLQSTLADNSGVLLVASPCASMKSTSPEDHGTVSSLLQQNNAAAAAASNGSTTNLLMPSSLLKAETADFQAEDLGHAGGATPVTKKPMNRLIDAVRSLSPAALKSSANLISSVMSMDDWVADGEFNTFQHGPFFSRQGGSQPPTKMKRIFEITASDSESSPLLDTCEVEANAEHGAKRQNTQNARSALLDEIESANSMLMDTIISIADDNITDGITSASGGTLINLSYTAVSLAPDLKALFATSETPIVMPTKLLVPADYPRSSPVLVTDQRPGEQVRNMFSDISGAADVAFRNTISGIPEPRSIRETASVWDACVRQAVAEFAQRFGGGTMFSFGFGGWESSGGGD